MYVEQLKENWNKGNSLLYLKQQGFNTPEFYLVAGEDRTKVYFRKMMRLHFHGKDQRISVRTYRENTKYSFVEPHFPNYYVCREFVESLEKLIDEGYSLILNKPIDPRDSLVSGNLLVKPYCGMRRFDYRFEYRLGSGTVRYLENHTDIKSSTNDIPKGKFKDRFLVIFDRAIATWLKDFENDGIPVVFEFAIYGKPIGYNSVNYIYWEIRRAW